MNWSVKRRNANQDRSQFEPVCYHNAENVQGELDGDELPARGMLGSLSCPDWDNSVQDAGSNAVDEARFSCGQHKRLTTARSINIPQIIQFLFIAEHCKLAPSTAHAAPKPMVLILPILSPVAPPSRQPHSVPR